MAERIQAIRGMNDVLPEHSALWQTVEQTLIDCVSLYGYQEIRFPLLESTQLFKRTIGSVTDIVEKEMYTFNDLNEESISLRPEGTAGCVRACLEHGLLHNQQQKLWYMGPMFRHEKPQKGRYRQFNQFGIEAFGIGGVHIEVELIQICRRIWEALGVSEALTLQVNSLGTLEERQIYRQALIDYFTPHVELLDLENQRRLHRSPLRILDSKNKELAPLLANAPKLEDFLSEESRAHFAGLCQSLDACNIAYKINPLLVRGLDYYGHTVFEWVTDKLGSQATVCAGGRFDKLVAQLGGSDTPAIGLALGLERLLLLIEALNKTPKKSMLPAFYLMTDTDEGMQTAFSLAEKIRSECGLKVFLHTAGGKFKNQFKKADKSGADFALILGEDELANASIGIKNLRNSEEQQNLSQADLISYIKEKICLSI